MNADYQLKLQAYLDHELSEPDAREVERTLAADGEARAISLPVTGRLSWIFSGDFLIGFRSRRFWSRCS